MTTLMAVQATIGSKPVRATIPSSAVKAMIFYTAKTVTMPSQRVWEKTPSPAVKAVT